MPAEDYLTALNILRQFGWRTGIEAALGFALHHSREEDARFERVRCDIEAYTGRGRALLLDEEHLYLYDPVRDQADVSRYAIAFIDDISLMLKGRGWPTQIWRVVRLDLLPDPQVPYIGEREHRIRYSCLDGILVAPGVISHQGATQSKSGETLDEANDPDAVGSGPCTVTEQPAAREMDGCTEDTGKTLESWKEILPETCTRLGKQVSEKTARELFRKHGIEFEERRGVVCVSLTELTKLPKPGAADV
jgi:hypothetical protein